MYSKKIVYLTFLLLIATLTVSATAAEVWWSGNGDERWDNNKNWWDAVPTAKDATFVDKEGDTTCLIDSAVSAVCDSLRVAEWNWDCALNITGGSLTVDNEMYIATLHHEWEGVDLYAQGMVYMSDGAVSIGGDFVICYDGWWGMLEITGGTIDVGGTLWIPRGADAGEGTAYGDLYLYGGTITAGDFASNDLGGGRGVDIITGQLIIDGDDTSDISDAVNEGWMVAYSGAIPVQYDYNVTNAGKTTVKASGCHWTDEGADSSWDTAGNWIGGVPTSSDLAGVIAAGTTCEIGSGVNAQCDICFISYFSNWGGAGNEVTLDVTGGTLTTQGDLIVGGTDYATGILDLGSGTVDIGGAITIGDNECSIDISGGTLKIAGDETQQVYDDTEIGKMIAYSGSGVLLFDYNVTNAGKTTVTGGVPTNQNWDNGDAGNSLWNDADNWVETSVPTKRDIPTIDIADSSCQITSVVNAVCLGLIVGDDAAGTSYLDMTGGTLKVGQNAVPSNVIIGGQSTGTGVVNISSGTADIEASLVVGNNGTGTLNVSGGTVNVDRALVIASGTGTGTVNLSGGTINAGADIINAGIEIKDLGTGLLDIDGGTLVLNGDATARIKEYAASGKIQAYGGRGTLNLDYNVTNSGKTTVTATSDDAVAYNPSPAGGTTFVSADPTLTWSAGSGATSHNVYLGTSFAAVDDATTGSDEYIGNQGTASYSPDTLDEGVVYYWRIDEVSGSTAKGNVWNLQVECPSDLRTAINFNDNWLYYRGAISGDAAGASSYDDAGWKSVHVPHSFKNIPTDVAGWVFDKADINWYRKYFKIPAAYSGKKVFIEFEGVDNTAAVWINGTAVSSHHGTIHKGAYLPFTVDVTDYVNFGSTVNVLAVKADNAYDETIPEYGRIGYGGLWRNVNMHIADNLYVTDAVDANIVAGGGVFVSFSNVSSSSASVKVNVHVQNDYESSKTCSVKAIILDADDNIVTSDTGVSQAIAASGAYTFTRNMTVSDPCLWHPDNPYLYTVITEVYDGTTHVDSYSTPVGIKTIAFDDVTGFSINESGLMWVGTNRVALYPWVGINMSDFQQKLDVQRMKDAGWQCVRNSHCPMSDSYMQACDEIGLMTVDQIPGFHHYLAGEFEQNSYRDMRDLVRRDRNNASVVVWELSLNETDYGQTYAQNAVAIGHAEIPQDPCYVGGWLWDYDYEFDVFMCAAQHWARNYEGSVPLVIDEHAHWDYGGSASTSDAYRGDGEAAMLQQAWNHQHSHHLNRERSDLCGDNVWVYNDVDVTLPSGAVDMYRLPKFSFYFWQSQRDPNLVLADANSEMVYIANHWTSGSTTDVRVYSNCDQVRLSINDNNQGTQNPDANDATHPTANLLQPPFTFEGLTFSSGELKAEGLIGGQVVATHIVNTAGSANKLEVDIDTMGYDVTANGEDMIFVYVSVADSSGNLVTTATNAVTLTVTGPAVIISPAVADAEAGIASFLIRTMPEAGAITAAATASGLTGDSDSITTVAHTDKVVWIEKVEVAAVPPGKASDPSPGNTDTDVSPDAILSWTAGSNATSHDVYFGTDSTPDETEFRENQVELTHDPNTLDISTTYYWRIDAKNSEGTTTGDVWSFTTGDGTYSDEANGETTVDGTVTSGDYTDTQTSNDTYEAITEEVTGGPPSSRQSLLEHKWTIDVTGGSTVTFYVEAYHTSNSENDDFIFAYSTDDDTYYNMLTVIKTSDDNGTQDYSLPGDLSGNVHIRVMDTDRTGGNSSADTIYVDHMYIVSE